MASKETIPLIQLFKVIEARFALQVIWSLRDGHSQTFRLLQDSIGKITPNTLNTRIKEFRSVELISHNGKGYVLTTLGKGFLRVLDDLNHFANNWSKVLVKSVDAPSDDAKLEKITRVKSAVVTVQSKTAANKKSKIEVKSNVSN
jgi:DNA-binding HxlR family transcriptional regulator